VRKPWLPFGTGEYGVALYGRVTYIDHSGREMRHPFSAEGGWPIQAVLWLEWGCSVAGTGGLNWARSPGSGRLCSF
jgi:hypothetical protein